MRRTPFVLLLTLGFFAVAVVAQAGADPQPAGFRLPDASAACRAQGPSVVCRSLGVRAGLALSGRSAPRTAREPIWWDASTPVLDEWSSGGVACRAAGGELVCVNGAGAGISASPHGIAASF